MIKKKNVFAQFLRKEQLAIASIFKRIIAGLN